MYHIPFHRRIIPWIFVISFLIITPAVIFYTSGYRWNQKKGIIEKNGTFIIDTTPSGAKIFIDNKDINKTTPFTIQDMSPGNHNIKLELKNYYSWSKNLNSIPEKVTFVNNITLWPKTKTELLIEDRNIIDFYTPTKSNFIILNKKESKNKSILIKYNLENNQKESTFITNFLPKSQNNLWNSTQNNSFITFDNQQKFLLESNPLKLFSLPDGEYHWEDNSLAADLTGSKLFISKNGIVQKEKQSPNIISSYQKLTIQNFSQQNKIALLLNKNAKTGFVLPHKNWKFHYLDSKNVILHYNNQWLWLDLEHKPYKYSLAQGEKIHCIQNKKTTCLIQNNNEIFLWHKKSIPELIIRNSQPITSSGWINNGTDIFLTTKKEVYIYNTDQRDQYLKTKIANFDNIYKVLFNNYNLYILGDKNNKHGIWKLPLRQDTSIILL